MTPEKRIAFVVGDASYAAGALPTAANDAGLIAQTLQAGGFEVIGARDLDGETLRQSYADFLSRVTDAGPNTVVFVYLAGYGLQYGNNNIYVPTGAAVSGATDIPVHSIRLSDLTGPLASLNLKARFTVFDAAYKAPFPVDGSTLNGFSLIDTTPGSLLAFNAAPGTVAPTGKGNFGLYALALAGELRDAGATPDQIFERVRLRVSTDSQGAEVPWTVSKVDAAFRFFDAGKGAPPPAATPAQVADLTSRPLRELPASQAFTAALARDTVQSYSDFGTAFPGDRLVARSRILLAARREAMTWRRAVSVDTPAAYWSYLERYGKGPHARFARQQLAKLAAPPVPPAGTEPITFDVPPPPPDELALVDAPVIELDDRGGALPSPPLYWLPPPLAAFLDLAAPPPPDGLFRLPIPAFAPLPAYADPPMFVAYPAKNRFFVGGFGGGVPFGSNVFISNHVVVNTIHDAILAGGQRGPGERSGSPAGRETGGGVALPAAAEQRAAALARRGITTLAQLDAGRAQPGDSTGAIVRPASRPVAPPAEQAVRPAPSTRPAASTRRNEAPRSVATTRPAVAAGPTPAGGAGRAAALRISQFRAQVARLRQVLDALRARDREANRGAAAAGQLARLRLARAQVGRARVNQPQFGRLPRFEQGQTPRILAMRLARRQRLAQARSLLAGFGPGPFGDDRLRSVGVGQPFGRGPRGRFGGFRFGSLRRGVFGRGGFGRGGLDPSLAGPGVSGPGGFARGYQPAGVYAFRPGGPGAFTGGPRLGGAGFGR